MTKLTKILIIVFLVLVLGFLGYGGYFLFKHKDAISTLNDNLPGKLLGPKAAQKAENLSAEKIIYWTNFYRGQNNLQPLTQNSLLTKASQKKVNDMFEKQYFEHNSPIGISPADLVTSVGYKFRVTGENLALGDFKDEKDLVDAWMNSPGHRANILNIDYAEIGVASDLQNYQDWGITWISVQEFGKPLPNCDEPNKNSLNNIESKRAEYDSLISQANALNAQADAKIQQGNKIAKTSGNATAQPYWDEGNALRNQADLVMAQAKTLQDEINSESNNYNTQVLDFNTCIKQ